MSESVGNSLLPSLDRDEGDVVRDPEINGTPLNFVFGPSSVCCCITIERSERNAVVQISAQMKFGQEDGVSCASPTWNSTESVGQLSLKKPAVPMSSAPLAQPVS